MAEKRLFSYHLIFAGILSVPCNPTKPKPLLVRDHSIHIHVFRLLTYLSLFQRFQTYTAYTH